MKKIAILLLFLFSASFTIGQTCATEKELPPDIKAWFEIHQVLMQNKVPEIKEDWTEADVFLAIHPEMQRTYRFLFWELREPGLKEVFEANLLYDAEKDEYDFSIIKSYSDYKNYFAPSVSGWRFIRSWAYGWIIHWGPKGDLK